MKITPAELELIMKWFWVYQNEVPVRPEDKQLANVIQTVLDSVKGIDINQLGR